MHSQQNAWTQLANDINTEFRRVDKFVIQMSPLTKVVFTDNWIIKLGSWPWKHQLAHQSHTRLELIKSFECAISPDDSDAGGVQYLR